MSQPEEVKLEKLKGAETYQLWKFQIDILLKSKGLYDYTDVECKCESTEKKKVTEWQTADAKVQNYIVTSVDKMVLVHLMNCKTGSEMYKKLKDLFERDTEQQKCVLLKKLLPIQVRSEAEGSRQHCSVGDYLVQTEGTR